MQKDLKRYLPLMLFFILCAFPANKCHAEGKGWELHSWNPIRLGWHFSLLPGTNRAKTIDEITDPKVAIAGVANLKNRLKELAPGANIYWVNHAKELIPRNVVNDLREFAEEAGINLVTMW